MQQIDEQSESALTSDSQSVSQSQQQQQQASCQRVHRESFHVVPPAAVHLALLLALLASLFLAMLLSFHNYITWSTGRFRVRHIPGDQVLQFQSAFFSILKVTRLSDDGDDHGDTVTRQQETVMHEGQLGTIPNGYVEQQHKNMHNGYVGQQQNSLHNGHVGQQQKSMDYEHVEQQYKSMDNGYVEQQRKTMHKGYG